MDITWARAFLSQDVTKFSAWRWYTPQTQCRDFRVLVIRYPRVPNVASTLEPHESASLFFFFRGRVLTATPFVPLSRDRL